MTKTVLSPEETRQLLASPHRPKRISRKQRRQMWAAFVKKADYQEALGKILKAFGFKEAKNEPPKQP